MQWLTMLVMFISGFGLGMLLDIYRVCKERFKIGGWVLSLLDLLYWLISAFFIFRLLLWSNWGELRFHIFVAIGLGFFIYLQWISEWLKPVLTRIVQYSINTINFFADIAFMIIWMPIVKTFRLFRMILMTVFVLPVTLLQKKEKK